MRRTLAPVLVLCLASFPGSGGQAGFDPFRDVDAVNETGLARLAAEAGDAALAQALGAKEAPQARERVLLAIRAAPFAAAPEALVPALVAHATGRDPVLAPEAALALSAISAHLRPSELAAREVLRVDLASALEALRASSEAPKVRPDIAFQLGSAAAAMKVLAASAP